MMKVRLLDRCECCDENQLSSRFNQKKIQFEWIFEVSAAGLELHPLDETGRLQPMA
jgi:hypothetical protein